MSSTRDKTSEYETSMRTKRELFFGDLEEAGTSSSSTSVEAASRIFGPSPTLGNPVAPKVGARFAENIPAMLAQPNMQMPALNDEKIAHAISNVTIYGDERDNIVTKWNYLQALWGVGKLFYSSCAPPVEIIQANPDNMGLVALNFNERLAVIAQRQQELVQTLYILIGNKPQYTVSVDTMRELENEGCQMIIYVEMTDGKRLLSTTLAHFLTQTTLEAHLRNLGIVKVFELTQPDETQVKNYLESGQNKLRGHKRILTPKINFHDLKRRLQFLKREHEDQAHQVDNFSSDLENVQAKLDEVVTKLLNQKGKWAEIDHRILQIMIKQIHFLKVTASVSPELKTLVPQIKDIIAEPTEIEEELSNECSSCDEHELLEHVDDEIEICDKLCSESSGSDEDECVEHDDDEEDQIKELLTIQQQGIETLKAMIDKDLKSLEMIKNGMTELHQTSNNSKQDKMSMETRN